MENQSVPPLKRKRVYISARAVIIFFVTLALGFLATFFLVVNRSRVEKLTMEQLIYEKSTKINEVVSKLLYKTQMLSYLVLQDDGGIADFHRIAATVVDDPAIQNILIAPSGVVTDVYPTEGNEAVLGLDFFAEGAGNKEAVMAMETGQLVLGGPFLARQGGQVLVGRLPVFLDGPEGTKDFWGLVSVTLKYPQALDGAELSELTTKGCAFELWRINPDDGKAQIISGSGHSYDENTSYVEKSITIANADWYFRIFPVRQWYEFPEAWISLLMVLLISVLIAAVTQNNGELTKVKSELETLSKTDMLTGIHNRRSFMASAAAQMNRLCRTGFGSFIIMFDLDHFKNINDTYGHQAGDAVLEAVCGRVTTILRPYDLFARYGGEEFIILATDLDETAVLLLTERIRASISALPIAANGATMDITASFGIAPAAPKYKLEAAIRLADSALYKAKGEGRNRVVFAEPIECKV